MESLNSDECTHLDGETRLLMAKTSREMRRTVMRSFTRVSIIVKPSDDLSHLLRCQEFGLALKSLRMHDDVLYRVRSLEPLASLHALQCWPMANQLGAFVSVTTLKFNDMWNVTSIEPLATIMHSITTSNFSDVDSVRGRMPEKPFEFKPMFRMTLLCNCLPIVFPSDS